MKKIALSFVLAVFLCAPALAVMPTPATVAADTPAPATNTDNNPADSNYANDDDDDEADEADDASAGSRIPLAPAAQAPKAKQTELKKEQNPGRFKLQYSEVKNKDYQPVKEYLIKDGFVERMVEALNQKLNIPSDITILFTEDEDMFYNPDTKAIHIGYNVLLEHEDQYKQLYPHSSEKEQQDFAVEAVTFFTFHELGHALIDIYDLPAVGNEETDGDTLAAIITMEYYENGIDIILDAATVFDVWDEALGRVYTEQDFEDEHSLNPRRFYNILCLAYGYAPEKMMTTFKELENKKLIQFAEERGDYCVYEYPRQRKAWLKLLEPHLK